MHLGVVAFNRPLIIFVDSRSIAKIELANSKLQYPAIEGDCNDRSSLASQEQLDVRHYNMPSSMYLSRVAITDPPLQLDATHTYSSQIRSRFGC